MTATTLAAALRMPVPASVAAPAPQALGVPAEPCATGTPAAGSPRGLGIEIGGIFGMDAPAFGLASGLKGSCRFGEGSSIRGGNDWRYRHDSEQLAGGSPLRA